MPRGSSLILITDPAYSRHDTGGGEHPEIPERLQVIQEAFAASSFAQNIKVFPPRPASRAELLACHDEAWLFRFEEAVLSGRTYVDHTDNQVCYESYEIATLSAGAGLSGIDLIEQGQAEGPVFCLTRPPGHHAETNQPLGFCFFNNCVIAARYWQNTYGRSRVAVFDFDAHHGNGIQSALESEPDSAYVSLHEHPSFSYPGTGWDEECGLGPGKGTILNLPLPPGAGDEEVRRLLPKIRAFFEEMRPEALVVGAGFDAHVEDEMSGLAYTTELYTELGRFIVELGRDFCDGRVLSILEGGYHLPCLGESAAAYIAGLLHQD